MLSSALKTFEDMMFSERFSATDGFLQRVNPQIKLFCFTVFILTAVSARTVMSMVFLFSLIIVLSIASKIPLRFFFLRSTIFVPIFAAVIASPLLFTTPGDKLFTVEYNKYLVSVTSEGVYKAAQFTLRIWVCVASLTLLLLTTGFYRLMLAMRRSRMPKVLVAMTAITYRFIFLFFDEAYRMILAKEARTVKKEGRLQTMRSLAYILSTLFIRAYERGERVYMAMTARGYAGETRSMDKMGFSRRDWIFGFACILSCFAILLVEFRP